MGSLLEQINNQQSTMTANTISNIKLFSNANTLKHYAVEEDDEIRYELLQNPLNRLVKSYQEAYPDYYEFRFITPDGFEDFRAAKRNIPNTTENEENTPLIKRILKWILDKCLESCRKRNKKWKK